MYVAVADTAGNSSRCTPAVISQSCGRAAHPWLMALSMVVVAAAVPNRGFDSAPHSPFAPGFVKSHWGTKSRLASLQVRVAVALKSSGSARAAVAVLSRTTYRLSVAFNAVLPSPNRSYETPRRGDRSFQPTMSVTAGHVWAGTKGPGPLACSGTHW